MRYTVVRMTAVSPARPSKSKITLGQYYTSDEVSRFMLDLVSPGPASRVMEAGAGQGAFIGALLAGGYHGATAFEFDPDSVAYLKAAFPSIRVVAGDFLASQADELFDLAIGNPPYVQWNNINPTTRAILAEGEFWKPYVSGEWDLLYAFIIWQIEKLRDGGELCLIVPTNWFASTHAASLRRYLASNGTFLDVISFGEFSPFADAAPNAIIFRYKKGAPDRDRLMRVIELTARRAEVSELLKEWRAELSRFDWNTSYEAYHDTWRAFTQRQFDGAGFWYLAAPSEESAFAELESSATTTLGEIANVGVGVVSGYNEAYRLDDVQLAAIPEAERALVHPFIKAINCQRWRVAGGAAYIFPESVPNEHEFRASYPILFAHLSFFRERLDERYMSANRAWYKWATVRNLPLFAANRDRAKLFVPCIDRNPRARYSYYAGDAMAAGDALVVVPRSDTSEDARFILAWLNSTIVDTWYRTKGNRIGHRLRYTPSYVERVPFRRIDFGNPTEVASHDEIVALAQSLIDESVSNAQAAERRIDELIEGLLEA